jgi:hypothetical protein
MSHPAAVETASALGAASRWGPLLRILLVAAALSAGAGVAAVTLLGRLVGAGAAPQPVPAPPAQAAIPLVPTAAAGDTTVPDAASVFAGRELALEEPAPTF